MGKIYLTPEKFAKPLRKVSAGDEIILKPGRYSSPLILQGITGTREMPIIIRPEVPRGESEDNTVITSDITEEEARRWANAEADRRERSGYYPSLGHVGNLSMFVLRNCQYVVVQGLNFEDCWTTAIYIDNSQYIAIEDVEFRGGTIAIGANGIDTHDIIIQNCEWRQDTTGKRIWEQIPWVRIHGASDNSVLDGVNIERDQRHWDGDFFRGWNIAGNVTIRNNLIQDAFNGIHCFNTHDRLAPGVDSTGLQFNGGRESTANFLIENNEFLRIRDNVFEPESHAWNWVIRHNHIHDCYRPFSFDFERAGFFYVYGNTASFVNKPSGDMCEEDKAEIPDKEWRTNPSLFKPRGVQQNEGPIYVFNNSWYMKVGKGILPKFAIGQLVYANNAMEFQMDKKKNARMFGANGNLPSKIPFSLEAEKTDEKGRFTRRWTDYNIYMNGNIGDDLYYPEIFRQLGYDIGADAIQADPKFKNPESPDPTKRDFASAEPKTAASSIPLSLALPDGRRFHVPSGFNRGAVQPDGTYNLLDGNFKFLPDTSWLPDVDKRKAKNMV